MLRLIAALVVVTAGGLIAAPVPAGSDLKALVAGLSDPDQKVRQASSEALKGRTDAVPWLRRAARSADKDTASRAVALLNPHQTNRRPAAEKAIDACVRDGCIDLLTEWHQFWQPREEKDLWALDSEAQQLLTAFVNDRLAGRYSDPELDPVLKSQNGSSGLR